MVMKLDQVNKDQATQALRLVANWQPPVMREKNKYSPASCEWFLRVDGSHWEVDC